MVIDSVFQPLEHELWAMLEADIKAGEYSFFVASGLSATAGLLTGTQLAKRMIEKLYPRTVDPVARFRTRFGYSGALDLPVVSQLIEDRFNREKLIRFLTSCTDWNVQPYYEHNFLRLLAIEIGGPPRKALRIITTNFDDLLERSLSSNREVIVTHDQYNLARDYEPWVLKIHGCIKTHPIDTIRITTKDLNRPLENWKRAALQSCLDRRGLVVIGYGATDIHIKRTVVRAIQEAERETYWVSLGTPPRQILNALSRRGGRYLQMDAISFFRNLGMGENDLRQQV